MPKENASTRKNVLSVLKHTLCLGWFILKDSQKDPSLLQGWSHSLGFLILLG